MNVDAALEKELSRTAINLFQKRGCGFFANLFCLLERRWDDSIPTLCTDGLSMWINPDFFRNLTAELKISAIVHELRHCADDHMGRRGDRTPRRFNHAADHAINLELKADGFQIGATWLADPQYAGMSAEQIYNLLPEMPDEDYELPFGEDFELPADAELPAPGTGITPSDKAARILIQAATMSQMDKSWGDVPGSIKLKIEKLLNPELPWQSILRKFLDAKSKNSFSWARPSRRFPTAYMPSRNSPQDSLNHVMWGFDISYSMTDAQVKVCNSEVAHVHNTYCPERTSVKSFDEVVCDEYEFCGEEIFTGLHFTGRGGTDLVPLFEKAREEKPEVLIVLSDLECMPIALEDAPPFPVVWICFDNPHATVEFGKLIHFNTK